MNDTMLKFGPYNVTPGDIWTLVPVHRVGPQDNQLLNTSLSRTFIPGWLVDSVFIVVILEICPFIRYSRPDKLIIWDP